MAGMLAGVECARRRRVHQSGDSPDVGTHGWTRRSSFCLYASNPETYHTSTSSMIIKQRSILNQTDMDEKLGVEAREAKGRLDERLRAQIKSEPKRHNIERERLKRVVGGRSMIVLGELQKEVYGTKKTGAKRFSWASLTWKVSDHYEGCLPGKIQAW